MAFSSILNTVRSYKNYGLVIQGNTYDPILTKGRISSSPSILISGNTCYLDYSHVYDTSDVIFLKRTFGRFSAGNTFYMQSTEYYDPNTGTREYVGGTLGFSSTLNEGKIIIASTKSGMTYSSTYNFYLKDNFVSTPQYVFSNTGLTANFIVNTLPSSVPLSFEKMGFLGSELGFEEYIDFSGATSSNYGRLVVGGTVTLQDNQELLYLTSGTTFQNLTSAATELKMYIRGSSDVSEIQQPENITGIYRIHDSNNKLVECYENQNYYQAYLRKQTLGTAYTGYWVQCDTCPDSIFSESLATDGVQSNLLFDNSVFLFISTISTNVATNLVPSITYGVFTQRSLSGSAQSAGRLSFAVAVGLKIDLSHASLQGWKFEIYSDPTFTIPISNNIHVSGQPGFDQAYVLVVSAVDVPRTLYCKLIGPQTLTMVFNI
jgi:hypothetical protein